MKSKFRTVLAFLLLLCPAVGLSHNNPFPPAEEETSEAWLLSTRCATLCGDLETGKTRIRYWRRGPDCRWEPAEAESFYKERSDARPTVFVVHGNRVSAGEDVNFAWPIYRHLKKCSEGRPFRLAIWSWPSDRISRRNRPDAQTKACYSDAQSYYLADSLRRLNPAAPVSLVGYSFGARIITGGLHLLAGGRLAGRQLPGAEENPESPARPAPVHAFLVAGALDCHWLSPGQRNGLALSQVQTMWITCNGCDPVLRWYPRLYGRGGPEALGYVGPACLADPEKVDLVDVSCSVGKEHRWEGYLYCSGLLHQLQAVVFP
ncbi:MAG: hypothetical protein JXB10_17525 [Pirellulales bacterium]|nr:hypothetical protein [Pirellulales bacterium]